MLNLLIFGGPKALRCRPSSHVAFQNASQGLNYATSNASQLRPRRHTDRLGVMQVLFQSGKLNRKLFLRNKLGNMPCIQNGIHWPKWQATSIHDPHSDTPFWHSVQGCQFGTSADCPNHPSVSLSEREKVNPSQSDSGCLNSVFPRCKSP